MKYVIWGLGAVGYAFLKALKENNKFIPELFYCVDADDKTKDKFISLGGLLTHYENNTITRDNYFMYLNKLEKGDYLLDFCICIRNLDIVNYCLKNGVHYLSTADSSWNPDPSWISDHQHYLNYLQLKEKYANNLPTCLIECGMNPGLVSSFAKKCLEEIVTNDKGKYVSRNREKLLKLLKENKFGLVAKKLGVEDIQEVDNDTQEVNIKYRDSVLYSTWNCWAYYYESVSLAEIAFGNKKRYYGYKSISDYDRKDLYLSLPKSGIEYYVSTYSPQGIVNGHITTHEEIFSIRRYFTYKNYRPTVHFVYSPCEVAKKSIYSYAHRTPDIFHVINKQEIVGGGESVGIIIQGKKFTTRYFGNYLLSGNLEDGSTITQVIAGVYAGFIYMENHPNEGLLFPEETNMNEMLEAAKQYLVKYISTPINKLFINLWKDNK